MVFRKRYSEPEGAPIVRIVGKLSAVGEVIYRELESGGGTEIRKASGDG